MTSFEIEKSNVGPGWQTIISDLHTSLSSLLPNYKVVQIKEKFGVLRYYFSSGSGASPDSIKAAYELVSNAEKKSTHTCENCGSTDDDVTTRGDGWIRTLCDSCRSS